MDHDTSQAVIKRERSRLGVAVGAVTVVSNERKMKTLLLHNFYIWMDKIKQHGSYRPFPVTNTPSADDQLLRVNELTQETKYISTWWLSLSPKPAPFLLTKKHNETTINTPRALRRALPSCSSFRHPHTQNASL